MTAVLAEHAPELDDMTRAVVIAVAGGAPGAALSVIEADVPGIDAALREIATTGDPYNVLRLDLAGKLALKPRCRVTKRFSAAHLRSSRRRRGADRARHWQRQSRPGKRRGNSPMLRYRSRYRPKVSCSRLRGGSQRWPLRRPGLDPGLGFFSGSIARNSLGPDQVRADESYLPFDKL